MEHPVRNMMDMGLPGRRKQGKFTAIYLIKPDPHWDRVEENREDLWLYSYSNPIPNGTLWYRSS